MDLLSKSKFYSEYLLKKMQDEDEAMRLKEKKFTERKKLKDEEEQRSKTKKRASAGGRASREKAGKAEQVEASRKRKNEEQEVSKPELARTFDGEDIPDHQPLLLTGGIVLQVCPTEVCLYNRFR